MEADSEKRTIQTKEKKTLKLEQETAYIYMYVCFSLFHSWTSGRLAVCRVCPYACDFHRDDSPMVTRRQDNIEICKHYVNLSRLFVGQEQSIGGKFHNHSGTLPRLLYEEMCHICFTSHPTMTGTVLNGFEYRIV